jgi:hypothetical protein
MSFLADIRCWDSVAAFEAHLKQHDRAVGAWADGLVYHHSAIPCASWASTNATKDWDRHEASLNTDQIRAKRLAQLRGVGAFYRDEKGWDRGPHLFVDDRFIYQLTPLDTPGIHAIGANADRIGIEVIGDYTHVPWPAPVARLALGCGAAWLRWQAIPVNPVSVRGHRDYNKPECPGNAIDLNAVRLRLAQINSPISAPSPIPAPAPQQPVTPDALLLAPPRAPLATLVAGVLARPHGEYTETDVRTILGWYYGDCVAAGLDPLLVVAQMVEETTNLSSWWAARPRRNPAGIGVTGAPSAGLSFPTWKESIIAHTGRLLAYALGPGQATAAQEARISAALRYRPLPYELRGTAASLHGLAGCWADDSLYDQQIVAVATRLRGAA